ncbi:hypothetical protein AWZ03_009552 [Drosophila navojoa]|uniref:DUF4794 domain-containing protein n=1 Tax=Drosophila navojoa TaxID=7232 RepID=A0A484B5H0_DRONA|nr:uncharacterized protein LOC108652131 [Drosophila navojoa]TDG44003.1 hypothetical protein AWZ03_009552 [Drosophila navojoa]
MANGTDRLKALKLLLILSGVLLGSDGAPTDAESHAATEQPIVESRSQKQDHDILELEEDLDGRSAYVNNQFVPSDPVELLDDEQNTPLYEILQKQMEQVLASSGPDVPIYEDDKTKRQRVQPPPNKPIFTSSNAADADDDYMDEIAPEPEESQGNAEKPDAASAAVEELPDQSGYEPPLLPSSTQPPSSTTTARIRPQRRRTTTPTPRTTRARASTHTKLTTSAPVNHTELLATTTTPAPVGSNNRPRPQPKPGISPSNMVPHDPHIYQHKRRIIFKTISTGSQFVNSPIGDLMIKFSIGFAKPASSMGVAQPSSEALRALSQNLMRSIEMQKLRRINKTQRH